jgi:hypothetical protein
MKKLHAGSDVDAYCSKCKMVLAHVIHAMVGDHPARVQCKTCNATHAFKERAADDPAPARARSTASPKPTGGGGKSRTKEAAQARAASSFAQALRGRTSAEARTYAVTERFTVGDVLEHKQFGLGVVNRVLDNRIEVLFPDSMRVLASGR